nr:immunoglobulin light chain junction region [Macaca mulatta]MOX82977.1 immunoglobulin light chain junction region [Macaca mulatta]
DYFCQVWDDTCDHWVF